MYLTIEYFIVLFMHMDSMKMFAFTMFVFLFNLRIICFFIYFTKMNK